MSKQDRAAVRTAQDLERKYNFSGMQRALKQAEDTITKINYMIEDFVKQTVGALKTFEGLVDGNVTTYYASGVPTLEASPYIEWSNPTDHKDDLYYDKDTGFVYRFNGEEWERDATQAIVKVMAIANSFSDTQDGQRRIFTDTPVPPYDNGDLWLKDNEIHRCQIAKPEGESYEENDFILAESYTEDTLTIKIGTELEVLKGTVLKVIESADQFKAEVYNRDRETSAAIELIEQMFSTLVVGEDGRSLMEQTEDGWAFNIQSIMEKVNEKAEETLDEVDDKMSAGVDRVVTNTGVKLDADGLTIDRSDSEMSSNYSHDGMTISRNGEKVLSATNTGVDAKNLHATTYLIIGKNSRFEDYQDQYTACFWIGD